MRINSCGWNANVQDFSNLVLIVIILVLVFSTFICNKNLSFYYRPTYFWLHVSISEAVGILKSKTFTNNLKLVSKLFRLEASNLFIVRWMKFHSRNEKSDETNLLPNYLEWIWMRPRHESFQHASVFLLKFT